MDEIAMKHTLFFLAQIENSIAKEPKIIETHTSKASIQTFS
jgi:hypothetical protein